MDVDLTQDDAEVLGDLFGQLVVRAAGVQEECPAGVELHQPFPFLFVGRFFLPFLPLRGRRGSSSLPDLPRTEIRIGLPLKSDAVRRIFSMRRISEK